MKLMPMDKKLKKMKPKNSIFPQWCSQAKFIAALISSNLHGELKNGWLPAGTQIHTGVSERELILNLNVWVRVYTPYAVKTVEVNDWEGIEQHTEEALLIMAVIQKAVEPHLSWAEEHRIKSFTTSLDYLTIPDLCVGDDC